MGLGSIWHIALLIFLLCLYFLPTFVANGRNHRNATPIVLINLFLGWTVIGWVGALVWATLHQPGDERA